MSQHESGAVNVTLNKTKRCGSRYIYVKLKAYRNKARSFFNVQFRFIKCHDLLALQIVTDEINRYNLLLFGYGKPCVVLLQVVTGLSGAASFQITVLHLLGCTVIWHCSHSKGMPGGSFFSQTFGVKWNSPANKMCLLHPVYLLFPHPPVIWPHPGPSLILRLSCLCHLPLLPHSPPPPPLLRPLFFHQPLLRPLYCDCSLSR